MQKRVYYFLDAYCTKEPTKNGITLKPLTRQEVERADLYNIEYINEQGGRVSKETILASFPPENKQVIGITGRLDRVGIGDRIGQ